MNNREVVVDIGYKSEGMIPSDQFSHDDLQHLKIGDRIQVYIEECEDADGNLRECGETVVGFAPPPLDLVTHLLEEPERTVLLAIGHLPKL